jgi:hypothetical protein
MLLTIIISLLPQMAGQLPSLSQNQLIITAELAGDVSAVALMAPYAYIGLEQDVVVFDVGHAATPLMLGRSPSLPDAVHNIAILNGHSSRYLYALAGVNLVILDLSDPIHPLPISHCMLPTIGEEIAVYQVPGGPVYAAIAAGESGLRLINVTDPLHPVEAGFLDTPGYAWRLAVDLTMASGRIYAYVVDRLSIVTILDITDATRPERIAIYGSFNNRLKGGGVAVANGLAFVGDLDRLEILDIVNPAQPQKIYETYIYVGVLDRLRVVDHVLLIFGQFGRLVLRSATPPWELYQASGFYDTVGEPYAVAALPPMPGQEIPLVVAACGSRGLQIVSWADLTHPTALSSYDLPGNAYGVSVKVGPQSAYAYVADRDGGMHVIDIMAPTHPIQVGAYDTHGMPWNVALAGTLAYVATGSPGLHIVDVADPSQPQNVGIFDPLHWGVDDFARDVAVKGTIAYVSDRAAGALRLVDISDSTQPIELGLFDSPGGAYAVAAAPDSPLVYLADGAAGLRIVDVSKPDSPFEIGSWQTPGVAVEVAISGTLAFVAGREEGLHIVDVSNPARPQLVATFDTPGLVWGVAVEGAWVYLADGPAGVRLLDVSDPAQPREAAAYVTPGYAWNVAVAGDQVYVAAESGGLVILRHTVLQPRYLPLVR